MQRLVASCLLALFVFSTTATYASVHHCKGELTDVSILSQASCSHNDQEVHKQQEEVSSDSKKGCCKKAKHQKEVEVDPCCETNGCDDSENDDCCDTQELNAVKNLLTKVQSNSIELVGIIHPSFYDFYFENTKILKRTYGIAYHAPRLERDIYIEVQCFRI